MSHRSQHIYEFETFRLDVAERLLLRDGAVVPLQPKVFDLLLALVERHGRLLEKDELMKLVWPDTVVEEANLANNISILRKTLGENGQQFIETVPKRGYRFVAPVEDLMDRSVEHVVVERPQTQVEVATGQEIDPDDRPGAPGSIRPKRWLAALTSRWMLALAALMVAVGGFWVTRTLRQPSASAGKMPRSIAVLPFKPLVAASQDEAMQMGMADTLILKLSGLKQLSVRSINSVRKYANPDQDPLAAGREQKVDFVLDSSFQRDSDKIRVRSRLLNVADETAVWTYQCDEQYCENLFVMQDTISQKVMAALSLHLTGAERERLRKHYTENKKAYDLYLWGRHHLEKGNPKDSFTSIDYFQQAVRIDPNYALAYVSLAEAYLSLGTGAERPKDVVPKAKAALAKALELDDQFAEAHTILGAIKNMYDWDRLGAEIAHKRALELNPNSELAHRLYAIFLISVGRFDEALVETDRALDLGPLLSVIYRDKGMILHLTGQYDRATEQLQKALELDPNFPTAHWWLMQVYEAMGDYDQAVAADLKYLAGWLSSPEEVVALRKAYTVSGWKGYWRKKLDLAKEKARRGGYANPHQFVTLYARLGEKEQVFAWMEKSYQERDFGLNSIKVNPYLNGLRSDPRFTDMLRRIGLEP